MTKKKTDIIKKTIYRFIRAGVWFFYPKVKVHGVENIPEGACIAVGNHSQMNGPIVSELYYPGDHYTWCISEMMNIKEVPDYAFLDFWSGKSPCIRWFYRILSYVIAPVSDIVFNNAYTIPVYRDKRVLTTFEESVRRLTEGAAIVIFPEDYDEHNNIVHDFQRGFVRVASMYHRKTKKDIHFLPIYVCPALKGLYIGHPVRFDPDAPIKEEQERICGYLMDSISEMAYELPSHRVVPYPNIPKKQYPYNTRR